MSAQNDALARKATAPDRHLGVSRRCRLRGAGGISSSHQTITLRTGGDVADVESTHRPFNDRADVAQLLGTPERIRASTRR